MTQVKEEHQRLLLDMPIGRYKVASLAKKWLAVFQKSEDARGMGHSEMTKKALSDVISGVVKTEDILKAYASLSQKNESHAHEEKTKIDEIESIKKETKKYEKHKK